MVTQHQIEMEKIKNEKNPIKDNDSIELSKVGYQLIFGIVTILSKPIFQKIF